MKNNPTREQKIMANYHWFLDLIASMKDNGYWQSVKSGSIYKIHHASKTMTFCGGKTIAEREETGMISAAIAMAGWTIDDTPNNKEMLGWVLMKSLENKLDPDDCEDILDCHNKLILAHLAEATEKYNFAIAQCAISEQRLNEMRELTKEAGERYQEVVKTFRDIVAAEVKDTFGSHCDSANQSFEDFLKSMANDVATNVEGAIEIMKRLASNALLDLVAEETSSIRLENDELRKRMDKLANQQVMLVNALNKILGKQ